MAQNRVNWTGGGRRKIGQEVEGERLDRRWRAKDWIGGGRRKIVQEMESERLDEDRLLLERDKRK